MVAGGDVINRIMFFDNYEQVIDGISGADGADEEWVNLFCCIIQLSLGIECSLICNMNQNVMESVLPF